MDFTDFVQRVFIWLFVEEEFGVLVGSVICENVGVNGGHPGVLSVIIYRFEHLTTHLTHLVQSGQVSIARVFFQILAIIFAFIVL